MARKKVIDLAVEQPASPEVAEGGEAPSGVEPADAIRQQDNASLQQLLAELAGSATARVTVYRANRNEPLKYMFQCSPEAFSLDELRDTYHGGDFRLYISRDGQLWKNIKVSVEPPPAVQSPIVPAQADIVIAMREGFERQAALMREMMTALRPQQPSLGSLPELIASITAAIGALRSVAEPRMPAMATPPPPAFDASKAVDLILKGVELARDLGDGGGEKSVMGLLGDLLKSPLLAEAVKAQHAPPVRRANPVPASGAPAAPAPAPAPQGAAPSVNGSNSEDAMLKTYITALVAKARAGSDPTLYADYILDNVPEPLIRHVLSHADIVGYLATIDPGVQAYREWFEELRAALQEGLEGDSTPDNTLTQQGELPKN